MHCHQGSDLLLQRRVILRRETVAVALVGGCDGELLLWFRFEREIGGRLLGDLRWQLIQPVGRFQ